MLSFILSSILDPLFDIELLSRLQSFFDEVSKN